MNAPSSQVGALHEIMLWETEVRENYTEVAGLPLVSASNRAQPCSENAWQDLRLALHQMVHF